MAKVKGKLRNLDMINDADIASSLDNQSRLVVEDERPVK